MNAIRTLNWVALHHHLSFAKRRVVAAIIRFNDGRCSRAYVERRGNIYNKLLRETERRRAGNEALTKWERRYGRFV